MPVKSGEVEVRSRISRKRANLRVSLRAGLVLLGLASAVAVFGVLGAAANDAEQTQASSDASAIGLTEAQAIEIAKNVAPQIAGRDVLVAKAGPLSEVWEDSAALEWAKSLARDRLVWYMYFADADDGLGTIVVLDVVDGTAFEVMNLR